MKFNKEFSIGELYFECDLAQPLCFLFGWNLRTKIIALGLPFIIVSWSYA